MIYCDAHVHIYGCYDIALLLNNAVLNLYAHANKSTKGDDVALAICLTERRDCHFFSELFSKEGRNEKGQFVVERVWPGVCSLIRLTSKCVPDVPLYIFAGRQIVTKEGLEILCLTSDADVPERLSFDETRKRINASGGLCVINWAPGKWMFKRGKFISDILAKQDANSSDVLLVGDTSSRPQFWRLPPQMKFAKEIGVRVSTGSDPLPFGGEESLVGTYAMAFDLVIDKDEPASTIRHGLTACVSNAGGSNNGGNVIRIVGKRDGLIRFLMRQIKLRLN